jgi:hypothetical protein
VSVIRVIRAEFTRVKEAIGVIVEFTRVREAIGVIVEFTRVKEAIGVIMGYLGQLKLLLAWGC